MSELFKLFPYAMFRFSCIFSVELTQQVIESHIREYCRCPFHNLTRLLSFALDFILLGNVLKKCYHSSPHVLLVDQVRNPIREDLFHFYACFGELVTHDIQLCVFMIEFISKKDLIWLVRHSSTDVCSNANSYFF